MRSSRHKRERDFGVTALVAFFVFATSMSGLTAVMLTFPGSLLEPLWGLNPRARAHFQTMGAWALLLMLAVCLACAIAATGLHRRKRYGFIAAIVILGINLVGDSTNAVLAHDWRPLVGLPIGSLMLAYLFNKRRVFGMKA